MAEDRAALAATMFRTVERDAHTCAEIKDLATKAKVQMAQIKSTLRDIRIPVQI